MELVGDVGHLEPRSVHLETVLVLVEDSYVICAKYTIGLEIVLDTQRYS
jgi:hypothetical protein